MPAVQLPEKLNAAANPGVGPAPWRDSAHRWVAPGDVTSLQQRVPDTLSEALQRRVLPAEQGSSQWRVYATSRHFRRHCKHLRTAGGQF